MWHFKRQVFDILNVDHQRRHCLAGWRGLGLGLGHGTLLEVARRLARRPRNGEAGGYGRARVSGAGAVISTSVQAPLFRLWPVNVRIKAQWLTTRVSRQAGSSAIWARNSAARAAVDSPLSVAAGHHTSSIWLKSCSGQAAARRLAGVPISQEKW